ncbi:hypothetical protein [Chryseobacterium sp. FH2]|uniref:hypothetical protein n=1 Tax=Chryseobacterium sp. FH2 TaxID=1674291 RepID=UPI00069F3C1E|nr:hypothetical protein [Chryseobacterium sp. FH2]
MAKKSISELKEYFQAGKRPTEGQFGNLIDSYVHMDESSEYFTTLEYPADYQVGDYIEFVNFSPAMAHSGGFYEISVAYTRGNIASAATHLAAISHANPNLWRECGKINRNNYTDGQNNNCFTIDVNGAICRFRIRATKILGVTTGTMSVVIKVRSINKNDSWNGLDNRGNDSSSIPLQPMTDEWELLVGSAFSPESAKVALKVNKEGNVGIGLQNSKQKLTVSATQQLNQGGPTNGQDSTAILRLQSSNAGYGEVFDFGMNIGPSYAWVQPQDLNSPNETYNLSLNPRGGNVGIGTVNPTERLDVTGGIKSSMNGNEGGYIELENSGKGGSQFSKWRIYNMTGGYGNGLQFWGYSNDGNYGAKLWLGDNGNMALYGKLEAKDVVIAPTPTADFVFDSGYNLKTIDDLEQFIAKNKHLPEIPSAKEMEKNGLAVGDFQIKLLQKIEELTLYVISLKKEIEQLTTN